MWNEKIWYQLPIANKLFLIVIFYFSLVKTAMNPPHLYSKLRKDYIAGIGHGAIAIEETKTIAHLPIWKG
jgi:hypothetical protein